MISIFNSDSIKELVEQSVVELYGREAINEVKTVDHAHGEKLSHKILDNFFKVTAPKFATLIAVENALSALYKQNNIQLEPNGLKEIISSYKKRKNMTEAQLDEVSLTSDEKKSKDKLVVKLKKLMKEYRLRYKNSDDLANQILATVIVKSN